jgi:hypothetical protein
MAIAACLLQISAAWLCGQVNQIIYSSSLQNGWTDSDSWASDNLACANPVLPSFSNSISVFCTEYAALVLSQTPSSSVDYAALTFFLNGGDTGGQVLTVTGTLDGVDQTLYTLPALAANTWQEFTIPLSALGVADQTNFDGIWFLNYTDSSIPPFYVGDVFLVAGSLPPLPPPPPLPNANNVAIYSNALVNGWVDGSYNCTRNFANLSPTYTGSGYSISAIVTSAYGGIELDHTAMTNTAYADITFWLNGGAYGGQRLQMYGRANGVIQASRYYLNIPLADAWAQYTVPLSALGVADITDFTGFAIQDSAGGTEPEFYLDDIQLTSATAPSVTLLSVNASQPIRTADTRWFGLNTPIWDSVLDTPQTMALLTNMGATALRFPGGSDSDDFHWLQNKEDNVTYKWETSLASFIQVVTNLNAQTMITLNYGTGSTNEAAAWVAYVNAATTNKQSLGVDTYGFNWGTAGSWASLRAAAPLATDDGSNWLRISQAAPLNFKCWEIGNEIYGSWETDSNTVPHDPYTYAVRAKAFISLIKEVDPAVKIGVVVETGEDSYVNNTSHPVVNPVTGVTHYGWTPVLLATLKSEGVTPDFAIFHNYPQNPGGENDAGLLASSTAWASDAANLRQMISDYMGTAIGTNIELVCTENNSVSSTYGKQTVSLVNGLYKMDSLAQLMQTEFNGLFWWDLRNGYETNGNLSASLYGWREYGDYGVVEGFTNLFPTYYTSELMTHFAQAGDTVVTAASDWPLLSTYAVLRQGGDLTVLTINKDPVNTLTGQVSVAGFTPTSEVTVYSYGIPQDDAAETGTGSPDVAQTSIFVTGTNFNYAFAPYSATVMALSPPAATDFIYTTNADNTLTITGYTGYGGAVAIPTSINNLTVTGIGNGQNSVFSASLNSVTIPNTVTSIRTNAFSDCTSLTSVEMGTNVTSIGPFAFYQCISLTNVTLGGNVACIGASAFYQCISLAGITIPGNVTNIGSEAFQYCSSLTGVYFQGNAPSADSTVFTNDNNATAYYLPGTTGWEATFGGIPTALLFLPNPVILNNGPSFGVLSNRFGFIISWATNVSVVVEACTNLASPVWIPLQTNMITNGSVYFSEPLQTNSSGRYYRVSLP